MRIKFNVSENMLAEDKDSQDDGSFYFCIKYYKDIIKGNKDHGSL